jgi:hypothetical protein
MRRLAISGVVCITILMLLGFSAVPQEPARKGADTEAGQPICFEPSIECVLVLRGQLIIVKCYVALSYDTPLRLVSDG